MHNGDCRSIAGDAEVLKGLSYPKLQSKPAGDAVGWQGAGYFSLSAHALPLKCRLM